MSEEFKQPDQEETISSADGASVAGNIDEKTIAPVWLVHMGSGSGKQSERAGKRCFRRPKAKRVRVGNEAQLFDYKGKENGLIYGGVVPAVMGFMLPMTIVITIFFALALGLGVNLFIKGIDGDEEVFEFVEQIMEESLDAEGNFDFAQYAENLSSSLDDLPTEVYVFLACLYLAIFAVAFVCIPICLRQMENRRRFMTLGMQGKGRIGKFFFGWLLGAVAVVVPFLLTAAMTGTPIQINPEIGFGRQWLLPNLFGLLFFCAQGSFEELIFRGWSFTTLGKRYGRTVSVIVSSLAFACLHYSATAESLMSVANAFLLGCVFCILTLWSGDIFLACGFHAMWNYLQFTIASGFTDAGGWLVKTETLSEMADGTLSFVLLEAGVIIALGIVALLYWKRVKRDGGMDEQPLPAAVFV